MKKWLTFGLVVLALSVGGYLCYGLFHKAEKVAQIESIVPDEVIYYLYSYNTKDKLENFSKSQLYQKISNLSVYRKFAESYLKKLRKKTPLLDKTFAEDCALAIFSSRAILFESKKFSSTMQPGKFIFLCRVGPKINLSKTIGDLYLNIFANRKTGHSRYNGIKITSYRLLNEARRVDIVLSYAILGDVFVLGNDSALIKKSIDLYKRKSEKSLLNNKLFAKSAEIQGVVKKDVLLWTYTSYKNYYKGFLSEIAKGYLHNEDFTIEKGIEFGQLRRVMKSVIDISIGMFAFLDYDELKEGFICKTYQFFDSSKDKKHFLNMFSLSKGLEGDFSKITPPDVIGYCRLSGDLKQYLRYLEVSTPPADGKANLRGLKLFRYGLGNILGTSGFIRKVEPFLGVNIEKDILPLLGENIGVIFSDLEEVYFSSPEGKKSFAQMFSYPLPHLALFAEAKSKEDAFKLKSLITQKAFVSLNKMNNEWSIPSEDALTQNDVQLSDERYKGIDLKVLTVKKFPLKPNCFVLGKYIIISPTLSFTKKTIDVYKELDVSLNSKFDRKKMFFPNSFILYFDFSTAVKKFTQTNLFRFFRSGVPMFSKGTISSQDIDSIVDILDDISLITQSYRMSEEGVGEGLFSIKVEGL